MALAAPPSRDAQLSKTRACCRRWIDAIEGSDRGALWQVLSRACDDAEILGLNDEAFQTFVKNAKRFHRHLHDHRIAESMAFHAHKTKPRPRAATGNEPRPKIGTQQDIVDAIRLL